MRAARLGALAALLPLAGCGAHHSRADSAESHAPGTTTSPIPAACGKYPQGAVGVVRTYCDGPAVVSLTVGGAKHVMTGGTCAHRDGVFSLKLGVVFGPQLAGARPDYFELTTTDAAGPFSNAGLVLSLGGKSYGLAANSGVLSGADGQFTARNQQDGAQVLGDFRC